MQDRIVEILLLVLLAVVSLFALVALLDWVLPDGAQLGDWADIALAVVTILAILFGGMFAAVKFELFRESEPHLTVSHTINQRRLGGGYIHLDVATVMHNNSKVKVELRDGYFLLQQVAPVTAEMDFLGENLLYPPWPILDEMSFSLGDDDIVLEPGQSLQEVFQFMIPHHVETLLIHYILFDSASPGDKSRGWGITEVYDIISHGV
ncbi:MAG: hypothetical protein OXR67_15955 [Chloroflexota bacterium]|nr:hypothetical protein [Chloroflexota bacterium]